MDPTPQQVSAMADELSTLVKSLETSNDPSALKETKAAVVMKAKSLIGQIQDPMDAVMDHVTNVSPSQETTTWSNLITSIAGICGIGCSCTDGNRCIRSHTVARKHRCQRAS